jgi:hypothetical protein
VRAAFSPAPHAFDEATDEQRTDHIESGPQRLKDVNCYALLVPYRTPSIFSPARIMQAYTLIAAFVHGNALGVVLEPAGARGHFAPSDLPNTWQVKIGPLVAEVAIGSEFPKEDYKLVVRDLAKFCEEKGIQCPAGDGGDLNELPADRLKKGRRQK